MSYSQSQAVGIDTRPPVSLEDSMTVFQQDQASRHLLGEEMSDLYLRFSEKDNLAFKPLMDEERCQK